MDEWLWEWKPQQFYILFHFLRNALAVSEIDLSYLVLTLGLWVWLLCYTVDFLLTDTSIRWTPLYNGHLELVPAFVYSLYLTLYKTDT